MQQKNQIYAEERNAESCEYIKYGKNKIKFYFMILPSFIVIYHYKLAIKMFYY